MLNFIYKLLRYYSPKILSELIKPSAIFELSAYVPEAIFWIISLILDGEDASEEPICPLKLLMKAASPDMLTLSEED